MAYLFQTINQNFYLRRYPLEKKSNLQAWDASDSYLLEHLYKLELKNKNIAIFNDSFGALSLALNTYSPTVIIDSFLSKISIKKNLSENGISLNNIKIITPFTEHEKHYDFILIKLPKTTDFLHYFLYKIRHHIGSETQIIISGMMKNIPRTIWKSLEETIGQTTTSLAKKKAKLIFVKAEKKLPKTKFPSQFRQENTNNKIYNHANVFSKQSLDIGTRFLLNNLPELGEVKNCIDLGCGNGIVGLNLAQQYPNACITFTDESYMAVESARLTCINNLDDSEKHQFIVDDCLSKIKEQSADLIVCNPPFHQSHSIGLHIALKMFRQSFKTLKKGGCFVVVANRHLPYLSHLKKLFNRVDTIASNKKFLIFSMLRSRN